MYMVISLSHFVNINIFNSKDTIYSSIALYLILAVYALLPQTGLSKTYLAHPDLYIYDEDKVNSFPSRIGLALLPTASGPPVINMTLSRVSNDVTVALFPDKPFNTHSASIQLHCDYRAISITVNQSELHEAPLGHFSLCNHGLKGAISIPKTSNYPNGLQISIEPDGSELSASDNLRFDLEAIHRVTIDDLETVNDHNAVQMLREAIETTIRDNATIHSRVRRNVPDSDMTGKSTRQIPPQPLRIVHDPTKAEQYTVELYLIADASLVRAFRSDLNSLITYVNLLIANVNAIYSMFNIRIVVVRLEIWKVNQVDLYANDRSVLTALAQYKRTRTRIRHDCLHALIHDDPRVSIAKGKAEYRSMCVFSKCVGYTRMMVTYKGSQREVNVKDAARTMAHEIGHQFGLQHDNENCVCQMCIMATGEEFSATYTKWSICSIENLPSFLKHGMGVCLHDAPCSSTIAVFDGSPRTRSLSVRDKFTSVASSTLDPSSRSCEAEEEVGRLDENYFCGNGILDPGEECDCGTSESCPPSLQQCCDVTRCKLRPGSTCAGGACCHVQQIGHDAQGNEQFQCSLAPAGTTCRSESGSCDLPEYCDGQNAFCPADLYKVDGSDCYTEDGHYAYCIRGACRDSYSWCKALWGSQAERGHRDCFDQNYRSQPEDRIANCGKRLPRRESRFAEAKDWPGRPCHTPEDAECGRLWCHVRTERTQLIGFVDWRTVSMNAHMRSCAALAYDPIWPASDYATWDAARLRQMNFDVAGSGYRSAVTQDAGMVPDGTPCSRGMCYNGSCVPVNVVRSRIACDCIGPGHCNNLGQCHCSPGFHPPRCEAGGDGGSLFSGPPPKGKHLDPRLVAFIAVLFIVILPLTVFFIYCAVYHKCRWSSVVAGPMIFTRTGMFRLWNRDWLRSCRNCFRPKSSEIDRPVVNGHCANGLGREPILMYHESKLQNGSCAKVTAVGEKSPTLLLPLLKRAWNPHTKDVATPHDLNLSANNHQLSTSIGNRYKLPHVITPVSAGPHSPSVREVTDISSPPAISKPKLKSTTYKGPTFPVDQASRVLQKPPNANFRR